MTKAVYGIGDNVMLVTGPVRTGRPDGEFTILACLPDINGTAQYRVKSVTENFERRILGTDIDLERSQAPRKDQQEVLDFTPTRGSWLKSASVRVGK
jgi:hypothetical protein